MPWRYQAKPAPTDPLEKQERLFYRLKGEQLYSVPLGLIEGDLPWTFSEQIFIDDKPSCYEFANETHIMTAAEVFEKYGEP